MAVTKIKPVKSTLSKALDYIQNPDKTDGKMLVSSFGCSYETADIEFAFTLSQALDTLTQSQKRIAELDVIIKRLYEDNISGKLSDERFIKLSRDYELEQTNLTNLVEHLRQEVKEQEKQKVNVRQFIAAVRKYTDMQQLDASVLREFVDKIYISEVYTPDENEPRIKVREIEIVYNFIGAFDFEEAREQSQAAQKEKKTGVA